VASRRREGNGSPRPSPPASFVDHLPVGVLVCDAELRPLAASAPLLRICEPSGRAAPEAVLERLLGATVRGTVDPYPPSRHPLLAAARGVVSAARDLEIVVEDRRVSLDVRAGVVRDGSGAATHIVATVADVTDERLAEDHAALLHSLQSVNLFGAGAARRFGEVLDTVVGHTQRALGTLDEKAAARAELEAVVEAGEAASSLVRDLLLLTTAPDDDSPPATVAELLEGLAHLLEPLLAIAGVRLTAELEPGLATCCAPAAGLHQVVLELVKNALDALPRGGEIRLRGRLFAATEDHPILPAGDYVAVAIEDEGTGIPPETETRIFEPFFTTKGDGRGRGLTFVYGWVKSRGGYINVDTTVGSGTAVTVYLPAETG
jgi:signal transduction histidine kinase